MDYRFRGSDNSLVQMQYFKGLQEGVLSERGFWKPRLEASSQLPPSDKNKKPPRGGGFLLEVIVYFRSIILPEAV